nr:MAG TPA: hypothetical protein [Caudoviricetes sp.]
MLSIVYVHKPNYYHSCIILLKNNAVVAFS